MKKIRSQDKAICLISLRRRHRKTKKEGKEVLRDVVKKCVKTEKRQGECRFCQQIMAVEAPRAWKDSDIDELVTETCSCEKAQQYSRKKQRVEKMETNIEETFSKDAFFLPEEARTLMKAAALQIMESKIDSIQVKRDDVVFSVKENGDGALQIGATKKVETGSKV